MIKKMKEKKNPEMIIEHKELFTQREREREREREKGPKVENDFTMKTKSFSKTFE